MIRIPKEYVSQMETRNGRIDLMQICGFRNDNYFGVNQFGEKFEATITRVSIALRTYQKNGWIKVSYYGKNGVLRFFRFAGRWDGKTINLDLERACYPML